jgi:cytosine/adenosine deaminase-related metal-dependent hydrolase
MFSEMRLALRLHGTPPLDGPALSERDVFAMATTEGARLMGKDGSLGRLAPGFLADMVLVDLGRLTFPWVAPEVDPRALIVYRARCGDVAAVVVGGELVFADGRPTRFDVGEVAREVAAILSSQPFRADRAALVARLDPLLRAWYLPYSAYNSRR